ncbi:MULTISPECIES: hypothetical protein [Kitasatospora]|uniref:hypothetical protein n=1 Tax=Kitasatospora TaxID=2063 RepID=UPI000CBAE3C0|nr:hypothetical protein [Kitasatospora sp. GP30]MDH6145858.1 hypothetical protein [Kitasatospora sp. GP30]
MSQVQSIPILTVGSLARELADRPGHIHETLRSYEALAALWVRASDTAAREAAELQALTLLAARALVAGEVGFTLPPGSTAPAALAADESLVRLPAALAVQGVEWLDLVGLAQAWLANRTDDGPVRVIGVRTGGAYLAPVVVACLEAAGIDVALASLRSGQFLDVDERRVILVDDPPLTCRTLLALAREVGTPSGTEVLLPCFSDDDVRPMRDAGIPVTTLPREQWQSTLRLASRSLSDCLAAEADWLGERPLTLDGYLTGRHNSVHAPWPGLRLRSPARAAVRLSSAAGQREAVVSWIPPGRFGDAARYAATLSSPLLPATLAVAPSLIVTEIVHGTPLPDEGPDGLADAAIDYALLRGERLPFTLGPGRPAPEVLHKVARALTGAEHPDTIEQLSWHLALLPPSAPDNRCEAEKFLVDSSGTLRKTGHLTHAYRRDNELLSPLIDLAALGITFDLDLAELTGRMRHRHPGEWGPALAAATLCYGIARGEQLPRTYNPQRAEQNAVAAYRLQRSMAEAATVLRTAIRVEGLVEDQLPPVAHTWPAAPAALVQTVLPFAPTGIAEPSDLDLPPDQVARCVADWAGDRFALVRSGTDLLLAPRSLPARWAQAAEDLAELAGLLPDPRLLRWCGVPVVSLAVSC